MEGRLPALTCGELVEPARPKGPSAHTRAFQMSARVFERRLSAGGFLLEAFHFVSTVSFERTRARRDGAAP